MKLLTMTQQEVLWRNIMNGVNDHGGFLKSFGETFIRADASNRLLLLKVANDLIRKYGLREEPDLFIPN